MPINRQKRNDLMKDAKTKGLIAVCAIGVVGVAYFALRPATTDETMTAEAPAAPTSLTVVSWGGAYTESQVRAYHNPYMAANPHIQIINDDGSANALAGLRAQSQAGNVTWDLVD